MKESELTFNIAAVEREVGLSKDVLRVWERRYGFPQPARDAHGERLYPAEQVARLALVKRLLDRGHRPGKLLQAPLDELQALAGSGTGQAPQAASPRPVDDARLGELMRLVRARDAVALSEALQQRLALQGLRAFVLDTVAPMATRVGFDWACGELQIHEEHLFTELVQRVLRQAVAQLPRGGPPVVLLTTVPEEPHGLGLLMLEAVLALEGARCINLGPRLPVLEIARAAQDLRADVAALSFSAAYPARQVGPVVAQLRSALPARQQLWVGGQGAGRMGAIDGVQRLPDFDAAVTALKAWTAGR